ncbi:MAG: hypothetical protein ACJ0OP_00565 [Thermodesulfobacteriota bacterium]|tara:strand:- start:1221 stop:1436 length:216 start_codon:yes stop_codon:yes gene_type:complete
MIVEAFLGLLFYERMLILGFVVSVCLLLRAIIKPREVDEKRPISLLSPVEKVIFILAIVLVVILLIALMLK